MALSSHSKPVPDILDKEYIDDLKQTKAAVKDAKQDKAWTAVMKQTIDMLIDSAPTLKKLDSLQSFVRSVKQLKSDVAALAIASKSDTTSMGHLNAFVSAYRDNFQVLAIDKFDDYKNMVKDFKSAKEKLGAKLKEIQKLQKEFKLTEKDKAVLLELNKKHAKQLAAFVGMEENLRQLHLGDARLTARVRTMVSGEESLIALATSSAAGHNSLLGDLEKMIHAMIQAMDASLADFAKVEYVHDGVIAKISAASNPHAFMNKSSAAASKTEDKRDPALTTTTPPSPSKSTK